MAIKATWPHQRRVKDLGPVRRSDDHHRGHPPLPPLIPGAIVEAIHLGEELVQRLLPLLVPTGTAPHLRQGIELIEEENAGGATLGSPEELSYPGSPSTYKDLDEVRGRAGDEARTRLLSRCPGKQRLPTAWRTREEKTTWTASPKLVEALGAAEELHHLLELEPCVINASHTIPRHAPSTAALPLSGLPYQSLLRAIHESAHHAIADGQVDQGDEGYKDRPQALRETTGQ
mmetsp:Transcript_49398/g.107577  ORF Transcript_49398/g.107577 Transcript_49398/m.107577 type:complete len:231 (-) Transcript_49398:316-1008(-)